MGPRLRAGLDRSHQGQRRHHPRQRRPHRRKWARPATASGGAACTAGAPANAPSTASSSASSSARSAPTSSAAATNPTSKFCARRSASSWRTPSRRRPRAAAWSCPPATAPTAGPHTATSASRGGPPHLTHLYHASLSESDHDIVTRVRDRWMNGGGDDWNDIPLTGDRGGARTEFSRFQYYDGKNPDWPVQTMSADYEQVAGYIEAMERDTRTVQADHRRQQLASQPRHRQGPHPDHYGARPRRSTTAASSAPPSGTSTPASSRPGLPPNVAALVDELSADKVSIRLVNTSSNDTRSLIVQAGAFGEHSFTDVSFDETTYSYDPASTPASALVPSRPPSCASTTVNGKHFTVELPPMTSVPARMRSRPVLQQSDLRLPLARRQRSQSSKVGSGRSLDQTAVQEDGGYGEEDGGQGEHVESRVAGGTFPAPRSRTPSPDARRGVSGAAHAIGSTQSGMTEMGKNAPLKK